MPSLRPRDSHNTSVLSTSVLKTRFLIAGFLAVSTAGEADGCARPTLARPSGFLVKISPWPYARRPLARQSAGRAAANAEPDEARGY